MQTLLLHLLRAAIGGGAVDNLAAGYIDWHGLLEFANRQGVTGLVWTAIQQHPELHSRMDSDSKLEWFGCMRMLEHDARNIYARSAWFADLMRPCRCIVLKGADYACFWPNPLHRECGDLDYYSGNGFEQSNERAKCLGAKIEYCGYKHSHVFWNGLRIENHRYLTAFDGTRKGKQAERILQEMLVPTETMAPIANTALLSPKPEFTAVFLLAHAQKHFTEEGIVLKHVLDWLFFLRKHHKDVDWQHVERIYDETGLARFRDLMSAYFTERLGVALPVEYNKVDATLLDRFGRDILSYKPVDRSRPRTVRQKAAKLAEMVYRRIKFRSVLKENVIVSIVNTVLFGYFHLVPTMDRE